MINTLIRSPWNYVPGETLFGFPYDWRQSNYQQMPLIMTAIEEAYKLVKKTLESKERREKKIYNSQ